MNEIDLKTKIEGLKKAIAEHNDFAGTYASELEKVEQELKDLGKPELTLSQMDDIHEAIEKGVDEFDWNDTDNFDFSDTDNFDIEYGINYDGKVNCDSHEFRNSDDLVQMVVDKVCKLFVEAECPEDELDTTEVDNHKPIK